MERMRNKDLENAWAVQGIRQEKCAKLEEENKKLKEDSKTLESAIGDVVRENRRLKKEIEKLKEKRIFSLGEYDYMILTSTTPQLKIIKKNQNYSLMEEDTLQELKDIGEI